MINVSSYEDTRVFELKGNKTKALIVKGKGKGQGNMGQTFWAESKGRMISQKMVKVRLRQENVSTTIPLDI